ncbi:toprim domain-containing protein, partial [Xenorhabdus anantnagensis]
AQFKLGFANRTLGYRLPAKKLKAGEEIRRRLRASGIMRESGHEHFVGSLVVPVIDLEGQVRELYGRKIGERLRGGTAAHLYLPGKHSGVWNAAALSACKSLILCESLIDAMSFWVSGHRNVTAAYGVNGVTADHWQAVEQYGIKQVLIAFDNDKAGNEAAVKLAAALAAKGITPLRVVFPPERDANGYLCQMAEPGSAFTLLLESAVPMQEVAGMVTVERSAVDSVTVPEVASSLAAEPAPNVAPGVVCESGDHGELLISIGTLQWCLRGMGAVKAGAAAMKLNAQVLDKQSGVLFADGVDLMSARSRNSYARLAATELGLGEAELRRSLGQVLLAAEQGQQQTASDTEHKAAEMSLTEREAALALLENPCLTTQITADLAACGVVGESTNLLAGYLAAVSRKLSKPLAVLIQSSSAAGKSSLMDAVLNLIPEEERVQYSAMTGQSLFYLGETHLQHKILAIAEEEGVRQAAYALKLLQSDGELTMASTGKDEATGNLVTKSYTVKGPVMLMLTTTAIDVDEELLNRCLVLTVNESREQTEAIHALQRQKQTLEGLLAENERDYLMQLHQNAQRLLKPLNVVNPYAHQLTFMSDKTRTRRDHMKYLTLIQSIALLHQYQRDIKTAEHRGKTLEYIEVTKDDIRLANQLAHDILGRTLDEMPPQTRRLLLLIQTWVRNSGQLRHEMLFTRKQLRDAVQWGDTQLKVHLSRLVEMEYLLLHRRGLTFVYELLFDGADSEAAHLSGLIVP